jgi:hypothetical protein
MEQTATGLIVFGWKLALALVAGIPGGCQHPDKLSAVI